MIRLQLLGALGLTGGDGHEIRPVLAQPKRFALLAYLALAEPRGFRRRDTLLPLFWPDTAGAPIAAPLPPLPAVAPGRRRDRHARRRRSRCLGRTVVGRCPHVRPTPRGGPRSRSARPLPRGPARRLLRVGCGARIGRMDRPHPPPLSRRRVHRGG